MDEADDFTGRSRRPSAREQNEVIARLSRLQADPMRFDYGDQQISDYTDRQFERVYSGGSDRPVVADFERFTPSVDSSDLVLAGSVGAGGDNRPPDVFKTAKLLHTAGGFEFAPGIEPVGEATPRFERALAEFQIDNDLKIDGLVHPGGPTLHALGRDALGPADGRPPSLAAAEFEDRFAKLADRTESGRPIFLPMSDTVTPPKIEGTGIELARFGGRPPTRPRKPELRKKESEPQTQEQPGGDRQPPGNRPPVGIPTPPGGNREGGGSIENPKRRLRRQRDEEREEPSPKPATIIRYPDGRMYLYVDRFGTFIRGTTEPDYVRILKLDPAEPLQREFIRKDGNPNFPAYDDRRTFEQRMAAGEEEYVYGPKFSKRGGLSGHTPLVHPHTGQLLRAPGKAVFLSLQQIRDMGLWSWYSTDDKPVMQRPIVE